MNQEDLHPGKKNRDMLNALSAKIEKPIRSFLPENFVISDWNSIASYFENLEARPLRNSSEMEKWLKDMSELEAVISEDVSWRQIRMTCNTEDKKLQESFHFLHDGDSAKNSTLC